MRKQPLDQRLGIAAQLVIRARIFFDIWWLYVGAPTRPKYLATMDEFSEFFRFDQHAHFVAFVVHITALFECRDDTINLVALRNELAADGAFVDKPSLDPKELLNRSKPLAKKAAILRHKVFAHRDHALSFAAAYETAKVSPAELRKLTKLGLQIANKMLAARGLAEGDFHPLSAKHAAAMLNALGALSRS